MELRVGEKAKIAGEKESLGRRRKEKGRIKEKVG
jgi:hypothetical protein